MKRTILLGACSLLAAAAVQASQVTWGAYQSNGVGIADSGGQPLALGDIVLLGHFNLTNSQIVANGNNRSFLLANFVQYASAFIGDGNPSGSVNPQDNTGYWLANSVNSSNALGIQGTEMYYWVFNAPVAANATQYGIFTAPSSNAWMFPLDTAIPPTTVTDLSQVPHDLTGILWGTFGTGTSSDGFSPLYNLAPITSVPESSTWVAGALLLSSLLPTFRRRLKK